jgi:hypothetical protein
VVSDLERSRAEFAALVRATRSPVPTPGGTGSPAALLLIGAFGTGTLAACAAALGGGLLYLPAAIPLATVVAVLASRRLSRRPPSKVR